MTQLGSRNSARLEIGAAAVAMPHSGCSTSAAATRAGTAGGMSGSSPCRLITIASGRQPARPHDLCDAIGTGHVFHRGHCHVRAEAGRDGADARIIRCHDHRGAPLARAQSQTHWINGRPATSRSGLPGRRLAPNRAGMIHVEGHVLTIGASGSAVDRPLQAPAPPRATSSEYRRARRKQGDRDGTRARALLPLPTERSGPLQIGHTSSSSRRLSILRFLAAATRGLLYGA